MAGRHDKVMGGEDVDSGSQASGGDRGVPESESDSSLSENGSPPNSPEGSPSSSPRGNPKVMKWIPAVKAPRGGAKPKPDLAYLYPFQAAQWADLGPGLAVRLERVALRLRVKREGGWTGQQGACMDAHELKSAWDKMVRAVQADDDLGCLFDVGRASSTE